MWLPNAGYTGPDKGEERRHEVGGAQPTQPSFPSRNVICAFRATHEIQATSAPGGRGGSVVTPAETMRFQRRTPIVELRPDACSGVGEGQGWGDLPTRSGRTSGGWKRSLWAPTKPPCMRHCLQAGEAFRGGPATVQEPRALTSNIGAFGCGVTRPVPRQLRGGPRAEPKRHGASVHWHLAENAPCSKAADRVKKHRQG